jgi:uncharacterized protein YprB with RNaseH-like and TPR domain
VQRSVEGASRVSKLKDRLGRLEASLGSPRAADGSATATGASTGASETWTAGASTGASETWTGRRLGAELLAAAARSSRIAQLRAQLARAGSKLRAEHAPGAQARVERDEEVDLITVGEDFFDRPTTSALPGERSDTELGPLRSIVTQLAAEHCHGAIALALALEASAQDIALLALDPTLASVDFRRALYIDTETTGLSGGSGTLPFLIGMAWFEDGRLTVEQLLLERPGLEAPMLARFAERLKQASAVVSFNGKSFDWPLLRTRFILQRFSAPPLPAHLDLLHCARRVYKRRLGSVRLIHLEEQILGFTRIDDIPGELIPQTYLGFVRGHVHGSALTPIIEHNRSDLIALAAMLGELTRRFRGEQPEQDARDQLGFAGVAARGYEHDRALRFARGAAEADLRGELAPEAHYLAGELCLRTGQTVAAERAFLLSVEAACGAPAQAARAHLALSKLYEHRLKRFDHALEHAKRALLHEGAEAGERRVARLSMKCRKTGPVLFD